MTPNPLPQYLAQLRRNRDTRKRAASDAMIQRAAMFPFRGGV